MKTTQALQPVHASRMICMHFSLVFLFLFSFVFVKAQEYKHQDIVVMNDTSTLKFQVLEDNAKITSESNVAYSWYLKSVITTTVGEYRGMLLDGDYREFDKNGRLRVQGAYKSGVKAGTWKKWSSNGKMIEMTTVKNEVKTHEVVAESRDTVDYKQGEDVAEKQSKKDVAKNDQSQKEIEKISWDQKKRYWINKWKFEKEQKRTAKESGDQIRKKNRREEKYIASPTG